MSATVITIGVEDQERPETIAEMRRLHREGWNAYELGARYNWPVRAIWRVVGRKSRCAPAGRSPAGE